MYMGNWDFLNTPSVIKQAKETADRINREIAMENINRDIRDEYKKKIISERLIQADKKDGKDRREGVSRGIIEKIFENVNKGGKRKNRRKSRKGQKQKQMFRRSKKSQTKRKMRK